jgi:hypothetical protein
MATFPSEIVITPSPRLLFLEGLARTISSLEDNLIPPPTAVGIEKASRAIPPERATEGPVANERDPETFPAPEETEMSPEASRREVPVDNSMNPVLLPLSEECNVMFPLDPDSAKPLPITMEPESTPECPDLIRTPPEEAL